MTDTLRVLTVLCSAVACGLAAGVEAVRLVEQLCEGEDVDLDAMIARLKAVTPEHLADFAAMSGVEFLVIDESTAMALGQEEPRHREPAFWVAGLSVFVFWNLGTVGSRLPLRIPAMIEPLSVLTSESNSALT